MGDPIKLAAARDLVDAGAVTGVDIVGFPGGWTVQLRTRAKPRVLATKSDAPREFATVESAVNVLRGLGLRLDSLRLDASRWDQTGLLSTRRRPDRAEALRKAHAAGAELEAMRAVPGDDPGQDAQPA